MNNLNFLTGIKSRYFRQASQADADCFTHSLFTSGDYSGCAAQAANRRALLENTKLCEKLGIEELNESYSTDSVLFPIAALQDSEILELFKSLENYPCLDDELLSEIESELENECFESFGLSDFRRHVESVTDFNLDDISDEQLTSVYYACASETNYNVFTVESGTSGFFDFDGFGGIGKKSIELFNKHLTKKEV